MNTQYNVSPADERVCDCLVPHVHKGCDSVPSPGVLAAIHAAAERKARHSRILPFVRFATAAAAMLAATLAGWLLIRSSMASETQRQVALMDDVLFLCAADETVPEVAPDDKREDLARRLLNLQGLDAATAPLAETPAEPPSPLSKDPQSRNMPELRAQKCG